jgi:hypothetical protein
MRMVNLGYVGRDQRGVRAHIDELAREGVPPPASIPLFIPLPLNNLVDAGTIQVVGAATSGEVEVVFLVDGDDILISVGSDHTDRGVERSSMAMSKALCPNVIADEVWNFSDIRGHWDELVLRSFVREHPDSEEILYQNAPLSSMMPAGELMSFAFDRLGSGGRKGLVLYSGTIPVLTHGFVYGSHFRGELVDPRRAQSLSCAYHIERISPEWDAVPVVHTAGSAAH